MPSDIEPVRHHQGPCTCSCISFRFDPLTADSLALRNKVTVAISEDASGSDVVLACHAHALIASSATRTANGSFPNARRRYPDFHFTVMIKDQAKSGRRASRRFARWRGRAVRLAGAAKRRGGGVGVLAPV